MTLSAEIRRQAGMIGYVATFHAYALTAFAVLPFIALVRMKSRAP
jgi:hypothetical protein